MSAIPLPLTPAQRLTFYRFRKLRMMVHAHRAKAAGNLPTAREFELEAERCAERIAAIHDALHLRVVGGDAA